MANSQEHIDAAQQEPAIPAAWMSDVGSVASAHEKKMGYVLESAFTTPLYTSPPAQRKPQEFVCSTGLCHYRNPLSDEEIDELWRELPPDTLLSDELNAFARAIEAAHGIKENT